MDEVNVAGVSVDRIVIQVAAGLMLAGGVYGAVAAWRRTNALTPWRIPCCVLSASAVAATTLIAGYVGVLVLYLAGSLLPDALVVAAWPLAIAAGAAMAWASAQGLLSALRLRLP